MKFPLRLILTVFVTLVCALHGAGQPVAEIAIDLAAPGRSFSGAMYGIFFEDINHAADGGLYAELVQNRDFENNAVPEGMHWVDDSTLVNPKGWRGSYRRPDELKFWSLLRGDGSSARMSLEKSHPLSPANPQSLKLEILRAGKGRVGVANEGFWGIAVRKGASYSLSFYARGDWRYTGKITASLESVSGKVYSSQVVEGIGKAWKQFQARLVPDADDPHARLVLSAGSTGSVWFDLVSLFPDDTWKGRRNGLRKDLARMLAGLRPSFVRFPGGCIVEGATLENRVQWKRTVGDLSERPGHWNLWGYHATDGLGFHEYLQMCEDLGARALYVINVGMSCQGRGGMVATEKELGGYLQEALDALEYALGPTTSRWGARRAADGHPAPFPLSYVEIGNENGGPDYQRAYRYIQSGIKRAYPAVTTIANEQVWLTDADRKANPGVSLEMIDEHYYQSHTYFFQESKKYDSYDRKDSVGIYVGEFAVTAGKPGRGNLRAALGEAAFMVGMERNADIVRMASYAPTFVNVNDRAWNPDMIVYDGSRSYGTPSYHALQMFSLNRPDRVAPTTVVYAPDTTGRRWSHLHGGIALSAWNTTAEFKDVRVERQDTVLLAGDFRGGAGRWVQNADEWVVNGGAFQNRRTLTEAIASTGDSSWTDYTLSLKARKLGGEEGFILYMLQNAENQVLWNIGGWGNSVDVLMQDRVDLGKRKEIAIETGKWYDIRMEVRGHHIRSYLDGVLRHDIDLHERGETTIVATSGVRESTGEVIVKIVNPFPAGVPCRIVVDGPESLQPDGAATVLASTSPDDENSLDQPMRVAPRSVRLSDVGHTFTYTAPASSLSILTLKAAR
jgi:alpha-L-arabinofuranosidase